MKYNPDTHHRQSIRLSGYDYSQIGAYFITIITQDRINLFGEIVDNEMQLNDAGCMVIRWWEELNHKFPLVETSEYVVMPNHFHGIVVISDAVGADLCVRPNSDTHATPYTHVMQGADAMQGADVINQGAHIGAPTKHCAMV